VFALDALDEIRDKPQGKSFRAFWEFLMDEKRQQDFSQMAEQLYQLLRDRNIDYNNDRFLKNLKRYLHASGKKVIDSNRKLSEKISRVLAEKSLLERRKAMELISNIRRMAYQLVDSKIKEDDFLIVEDEPFINLVDRWDLYEDKVELTNVLFPDGLGGMESGEANLKSLFDQSAIDKKKLTQRIEAMLKEKSQITLKEITDAYGLENGLSELIGYFLSHHQVDIISFWKVHPIL